MCLVAQRRNEISEPWNDEVLRKVPEALPMMVRIMPAATSRMLIGTWEWHRPFAPHLWSTMPVPWAHLIVSERTLLRACRRVYHAAWYVPTFHDFDVDGSRKHDRYTEDRISTYRSASRSTSPIWRTRPTPI